MALDFRQVDDQFGLKYRTCDRKGEPVAREGFGAGVFESDQENVSSAHTTPIPERSPTRARLAALAGLSPTVTWAPHAFKRRIT